MPREKIGISARQLSERSVPCNVTKGTMHMCGTALEVGQVSHDKNEAFPDFLQLGIPRSSSSRNAVKESYSGTPERQR